MRRKKIINLLLILTLVTSCGINTDNNKGHSSSQNEINTNDSLQYFPTSIKGVVGDDIAITRGQVSKILALTYLTKTEINSMEPSIIFQDLSVDSWYYNYANAVANLGIIKGDGVFFRGDDKLTIKEAQYIIDNLSNGSGTKLNVNDANEDKPISYGLWVELYNNLLEDTKGEETIKEKFGLEIKTPIVLGTNKFNNTIGEKHSVTNEGLLGTEGQNLDLFLDKKIKIYEKNGELVTVLSVEDETPTIKNAFVVSYDIQSITIFISGITRIYKVNNGYEESLSNNLCDITVEKGYAKALSVYTDSLSDVVMSYNDNEIEFKENGMYEIGEEYKVYSYVDNELKTKRANQVPVGKNIGKYIINNKKIIGLIMDKEDKIDNMRVGIKTSGFGSLIHSEIKITSDKDFTISSEKGVENYSQGDLVTINEENFENLFGGRRIYMDNGVDGKFEISSISRNWSNGETPKYRGSLEVSKVNGGFILTNELPVEEYLYAVVPSEMPTLYGVEAAKIQAITARSYAYNQYYSNKLANYGINVDDSISFQVYNNTPENSVSIEAVNATEGLCISNGKSVVSAYFFSTSSGGTADSGDVWSGTGSSTPLEFTGKSQLNSGDFGDLSLEENASVFFKEKDIDAYEKNSKWFRWNVTMNKEEISTSINRVIEARYNHNNNNILTKKEDGTYVSEPISSIGLVTDLKVLKRGKYGNVIEMEVVGTEKSIKVVSEYNIRTLLRPTQFISERSPITIETNNGIVNDYILMPSSFFTMDINYDENNNLADVKFFGGGNGHGVGMSQTGAFEMLNAGKTVEEVIKHYYTGVEIEKKI